MTEHLRPLASPRLHVERVDPYPPLDILARAVGAHEANIVAVGFEVRHQVDRFDLRDERRAQRVHVRLRFRRTAGRDRSDQSQGQQTAAEKPAAGARTRRGPT